MILTKKYLLLFIFVMAATCIQAQSIDSIFFNLYTDSLKKGSWNYINVDAKLSNGKYIPLNADQLIVQTNCGVLKGNSIWLAWETNCVFVIVDVQLKKNPALKQSIKIWIKQNDQQLLAPVNDSLIQKINQKNQSKGTKRRRGIN